MSVIMPRGCGRARASVSISPQRRSGRGGAVRDFTGPHYRARHVGGAILAIVAAISIGGLVSSPEEPIRVIPVVAAEPRRSPQGPDSLRQLLRKQAAAVNRGDLSGWLAPVAPSLRPHYQNLFRTLRALNATVDYRV